MGCCQTHQPVHAYYEPSGELVQFSYPKQHFPRKEFDYVQAHDLTKFYEGMECYVITSDWHNMWINFVTKATKTVPSPINNHLLLDETHSHLRKGLKHKKDYRPISKAVWQYYFKNYGGGPVIVFKVPGGFSEESYMKGLWIKKIDLSSIVTIIHPSEFPGKTDFVENPMGNDSIAESNASMAANMMLNDLSKKKFQQAKELQKEINASNAEAIGAMMMKDAGKKKMEEARELERQQNLEQSAAAANIFAGGLSQKRLEEARAADASAKISQTEEAAALFNKGAIKKRFKEALAAGNMKQAEILAATMLKNAWKGKKARQQVKELKLKKQRLMEEAMARKLQAKYRTRLAQRRVIKLREEKQRLREEACAIIVQSNWRIKKAREKVTRLKIEKQRLLEEGAALKVQSRWRIKQASRKVSGLRVEKQKKEEKRLWAIMKIATLLKMLRAKIIYRKLMLKNRHIFIIQLRNAKDINIGDVNSSDPYVLLHVEQPNPTATPVKGAGGSNIYGNTVSLFRSKVIYNTLNPVWNEDIYAVNASGSDTLVFTLMDKDNFTSDDFLGQTLIPLKNYPQLFSGKEIHFHKHPIGSFAIPIRDGKGKALPLSEMETIGKGEFDFSIRLAKPHLSHFGWVLKQAGQLISLGGSQWKPRFLVLLEGVLNYYDSDLTLDHPRGTIKCENITFLNYGPDKSGEMTLAIVAEAEEWYFHFNDTDTEVSRQAWVHKIATCSPNIKERDSVLQRSTSVSHTTPSTALPMVDVKNNSKITRRASFLFGGGKK